MTDRRKSRDNHSHRGQVHGQSRDGNNQHPPDEQYQQPSQAVDQRYYPQDAATLHSGAWDQDAAPYTSYPTSLEAAVAAGYPPDDQGRVGINQSSRHRRRHQSRRESIPSASFANPPVDQGGQSYPGRPPLAIYQQTQPVDTSQMTASVGMMPLQHTQSVSMAGDGFYDTGASSSYRQSASYSGDWPSNEPNVAGLSPQLRTLSLSSDDPSGYSTVASSYVASPGGGFSEQAYSASPPTIQDRMLSRRNSRATDDLRAFVPPGASAMTQQRRRSSTSVATSGSNQRRDSLQSGFQSPGAKKSATWHIPEELSAGETEDSQTSVQGSDDETRQQRPRRGSTMPPPQEIPQTGQGRKDKKSKKHQNSRTTVYVDDQGKEKRWYTPKDPKDRRDPGDGHGGYNNNRGYQVQY